MVLIARLTLYHMTDKYKTLMINISFHTRLRKHFGVRVLQDADSEIYMVLWVTDARSAGLLPDSRNSGKNAGTKSVP